VNYEWIPKSLYTCLTLWFLRKMREKNRTRQNNPPHGAVRHQESGTHDKTGEITPSGLEAPGSNL